MKTYITFLFALCSLMVAGAQSQVSQTSGNPKRSLEYKQAVYSNSTFVQQQTLRIEGGNVWINGNLIAKENLPEDLRNLRQDFIMETVLWGTSEFRFIIFGKEYLLSQGALILVPRSATNNAENYSNFNPSSSGGSNSNPAEGYYSARKNEQPNLFSDEVKEVKLHEKCMAIARNYFDANTELKPYVREELNICLGSWFDQNQNNKESEVKESMEELEKIRKDLEFRRRNKNIIIQNKMKELIGN